jgi:hypothetical protein
MGVNSQVESFSGLLFRGYGLPFINQRFEMKGYHLPETLKGFLAICAIISYIKGWNLSYHLPGILVFSDPY